MRMVPIARKCSGLIALADNKRDVLAHSVVSRREEMEESMTDTLMGRCVAERSPVASPGRVRSARYRGFRTGLSFPETRRNGRFGALANTDSSRRCNFRGTTFV